MALTFMCADNEWMRWSNMSKGMGTERNMQILLKFPNIYQAPTSSFLHLKQMSI